MSPEQVVGEALDARSDTFSFGLVLYEMATSERAFTGETGAILHDAIQHRNPRPIRELNSEISMGLESVIGKALQKDRERRYQSAAEMRADLEMLSSGKRVSSRRVWRWLAASVLLIVVAAGTWLYSRWRNRIKLTANDTIVLADFTNRTSDPVFDDALDTALRVELEQTPFLNLLAPDKVRGTQKLLNFAEDERLTPELGRTVCQHTNSRLLITGSISDAGNHFRINLEGIDCQSGKTIAASESDAASRNEVIQRLGSAGHELRNELGEPKVSLQKFNKPLEEALSSSLEAVQAFALGRKAEYATFESEAVPFYNRAIELDPTFANAYMSLGVVYASLAGSGYPNLHEASVGIENEKRAYELRERATERQRLHIEGRYYWRIMGDLHKAIQIYQEWIEVYPSDFLPHYMLSALFTETGQYENSIKEVREALRLVPDSVKFINSLVTSCLPGANRLDEGKSIVEAALARQPRRQRCTRPSIHWLSCCKTTLRWKSKLLGAPEDRRCRGGC